MTPVRKKLEHCIKLQWFTNLIKPYFILNKTQKEVHQSAKDGLQITEQKSKLMYWK